jgi:hypothetical protein
LFPYSKKKKKCGQKNLRRRKSMAPNANGKKLILKEFRFACASIKICRKLKRITTLAKIQPPGGPGCEKTAFSLHKI